MATPQCQPISSRLEHKSGLGPTPFPPPLKSPLDISPSYYFYTGTDIYTACRDFKDVQAVTRIAFGRHESSGNTTLPHRLHPPIKHITGAEGYPFLGSAALLAGSQPLEIRLPTGDKTAASKAVEDDIDRGFDLLLQRQETNAHRPRAWGMERVRARVLLRHSARVQADAAWTARARRMWGAIGAERPRGTSMPATAGVECDGMMQADGEARGGPRRFGRGAAVDGKGDGDGDADEVKEGDSESESESEEEEEEDDSDDLGQHASDDWDFGRDEEDNKSV